MVVYYESRKRELVKIHKVTCLLGKKQGKFRRDVSDIQLVS
jgi:hypothetical protein